MKSKLVMSSIQVSMALGLALQIFSSPTLASEVMAEHDKAVQVLAHSGEDKYKSRDYNGAVSDFSAAIKLDPNFAFLYYMRACNKHLLKDYEGALAGCSKAIAIAPKGNPIAYFQRAIAEYRLRKLNECISDCNMALKLAPDFPSSYIYRAHAESDKGDKKAALQDCDAYLKSNPTDPQALKFRLRLMSGG